MNNIGLKKKKKKKTAFSPYKNRKNNTSFGKNNFGETLGDGERPKKNKLWIHMKKNILSFNICKLDTM